jgi:PAS domain S-box-containing protein
MLVSGPVVLIGLLVLAPMLTAAGSGPRETALVAAAATALAIVAGIPDDIFGSADHAILCAAVAAGGALAVWLAELREAAEQTREQSAFLAAAAAELDSSLDYEATLRRVARIAVPAVADWCVVDMLDAEGRIERLAVTHVDPDKERLAWEIGNRYPVRAGDPVGAPHVIRTGEAECYGRITDDLLRAGTRDDEHRRLMEGLGLRSAIVAPLVARDRVLGALSLALAESGRRYGGPDLDFVRALAGRAAQAIDNARIYREARAAERAAEESSALLDTLFERAPIGLAYFDSELLFRRINEALAAMNGLPAEAHVGRGVEEVLPAMDSRVSLALREVLETGEPLVDEELEGETPAAPGRRRMFLASFYPVRDFTGEVAGIGAVVIDTTERHAAQEELVRQKGLYEALLQAQSDVGEGVLILEGEEILYANEACEKISGYRVDELLALPSLFQIVPPEEREALRARVAQRLRADRLEPAYETTIVHRTGRRVDLELGAKPLRHDGLARLVLVARDITERKRSEDLRALLLDAEREARAQAEVAERRSSFLAEASAALEASLDLDETCQSVARLCVPFLADLSVVDLWSNGSPQRRAIVGADPDRERLTREIQERYPLEPRADHPLARVIATGRTEVMPRVEDEFLEGVARNPEHLDLLRRVRFQTAVTAPLTARGRTFGSISVGRFGPTAAYGAAEVALLEDLAGRAALAIDNARLYAERSYVAQTLQRSLLPPAVPAIPGMEVAARYEAAGAGNEVGGDFYDVFETAEGGWAVVIGDVCGKGAPAAAITSLARYTIRAAAMHQSRPSGALATLNEALLRQGLDGQFSSVIYAALRPRLPVTEVTLCSAGHPLPIVLRAGGEVETAGAPGTLLGIAPDPRLLDAPLDLRPGDTVVLYTDGVTEARTPDGMFGPQRLADLVRSCAGLDAGGIAERIERTVVDLQDGEPRDDIAIVVMRVPPA